MFNRLVIQVRLKHVEKIMVTANSASTEGEVHVDEDVEDYDYDNAGDAGDYCPGIEGQEDAYGDGEERAGEGLGVDEALSTTGEERLGESGEGEYGGENLVEAPKTVDRAALQIG